MRNLVLFMHMSLDGYVQGPDKWDLAWIPYNEELEQFADDVVAATGSTVYGRVTYEGMRGYWPTVLDNSVEQRTRNQAREVAAAGPEGCGIRQHGRSAVEQHGADQG